MPQSIAAQQRETLRFVPIGTMLTAQLCIAEEEGNSYKASASPTTGFINRTSDSR
jgi:hypothetical protein